MSYNDIQCQAIIQDLDHFSQASIAKLILCRYPNTFKCTSIVHNMWYQFKNHRWMEVNGAICLHVIISSQIIHAYEEYASKELQCINQINKIAIIIKQLGSAAFRSGIIRICRDLAYDSYFLNKLDENKNLICFNNGVYDLEANIFRDGKPDDYISSCTNYDYVKHDSNSQHYNDVVTYFEKLQPNAEMREYLMAVLSSCLAGSTDKKLYIFHGLGLSGLSRLTKLMKQVLGDLAKSIWITGLTNLKGVRMCIADHDEDIDNIFNTKKSQFTSLLICNDLPTIKITDDMPEIKVIPFRTKFISKFNGLPGINQCYADNNLDNKLPEWRGLLMSMLIDYHRKYRTNRLICPDLVIQSTQAYLTQCANKPDIYYNFIEECLEKTEDAGNSISINIIYELMRKWYRYNFGGKCPRTVELRNYIASSMADSYDLRYDILIGYTFKPNRIC